MNSKMSKPSMRDIIDTTIRNHPKDCIFGPDPVDGAMRHLGNFEGIETGHLIDKVIEAIHSQEIYCPHEGIDRRNEAA